MNMAVRALSDAPEIRSAGRLLFDGVLQDVEGIKGEGGHFGLRSRRRFIE